MRGRDVSLGVSRTSDFLSDRNDRHTGLAVIIYEASEFQAPRAPSTSTSEH